MWRLWSLISAPFRTLHEGVKRVHTGWWALLSLIVAVAGVYYAMPRPAQMPAAQPVEPAGSSELVRIATNQSSPDNSLMAPAPQDEAVSQPGKCDANFEFEAQTKLRRLVETRIKECVSLFRDELELYYSCRKNRYGVQLSFKYQVSGAIHGEVLPFSAHYEGPEAMDLSQVKITSLAPRTFTRLCRAKERDNK